MNRWALVFASGLCGGMAFVLVMQARSRFSLLVVILLLLVAAGCLWEAARRIQ